MIYIYGKVRYSPHCECRVALLKSVSPHDNLTLGPHYNTRDRDIQKKQKLDLRVAGVLFTMQDNPKNNIIHPHDSNLSGFGTHVFSTIIPWDKTLRDASNYPKPLALRDITSCGAKAYLNFADEMMNLLKQRR